MSNYALVNKQTNICDNVISWDGDTNKWQPPETHLALLVDTTPSLRWRALFSKRFVERVALLEQGHQVAGYAPERSLFAGVGLFVECGERRDEGEAGSHHGGQLSREQHQVRFRDPAFGSPQPAGAALLDAEHQQSPGHEGLDGVVLIEGLLNPGNCFSSGVTGFVGECVHGAWCSEGQAIVEQDICLPGSETPGSSGLELLLKRLAKAIRVGEGRELHQTL